MSWIAIVVIIAGCIWWRFRKQIGCEQGFERCNCLQYEENRNRKAALVMTAQRVREIKRLTFACGALEA